MKKFLTIVLPIMVLIACIVLGFLEKIVLTDLQKETLKIVSIVAGCSAAYCFIVGEISRNNSQMDKLWSLLPIAYTWIIAVKGNFNFRLLIFAGIATLWGLRLTYNFARKGAYTIKFWSGEEDYRWAILRKNKFLSNKFLWALFDLFFISIYQNFIVLAITLPAIACMSSTTALSVLDIVAGCLALGFLILETVSDKYQRNFYETKKKLLKEGKTLEELPSPYNLGFNTTGIWNYMRHPNYLGEQGIWCSLYILCIGAGVTHYGIFNWTIFGCMLLVMLFLGSSTLGESITSGKYPEYANYQKKVFKYLPIRKFR